MDFSRTYRGVPYFGVWASESADVFGNRDAMAILATAIEQCQDDDLRHCRDVRDALDYLEQWGGRQPALAAFRAALDERHPVARRNAARAAYRRLCKAVSARVEVE